MSRKEQRTPEDRGRARLEREARRAAREGRPPPAALPPDEISPPPLETRAEPEPAWDEQEHQHRPEHQPEPEPYMEEAEHERHPEHQPEPEPDWEEPEHEPEPALSDRSRRPEPAEPNGLRLDEPWRSAAPNAGQAPEPPPRAPQRPAMPPPFQPSAQRRSDDSPTGYTLHRGSARRTTAHDVLYGGREAVGGARRGRRRWLIPVLALGVIGVIAIWFLLSLYQPLGGGGEGQVQVVIPRGAGVGAIGDLLADKGVISSPFFFKARARVSGRSGDLKPGTFRLRKDMSYAAALDALAQGPPPDIVRVTIPEGESRREVKGIVGKELGGDYLTLTQRSSLLDPKRYGAKRARDLEGFLFPATYDLKRGRPAADLVALQLRAFKREFPKVDLRGAARRRLTPYDVLTIASMVDREAQVSRERRIIASVIYNRLREGIPLGIDATVRFATNNWTRPLRRSEIEIDSPYNTRVRKGLPPGPIGSPGLAAIRAAARPATTGFLYYVVKPGTCGEHAFSRTTVAFDRDVSRYNAERSRRGGKSPTNC